MVLAPSVSPVLLKNKYTGLLPTSSCFAELHLEYKIIYTMSHLSHIAKLSCPQNSGLVTTLQV